MGAAGLRVENSKGECNLGQHEINFRYADALQAADEHVVYKNGAKEIAAQEGMAITFMAKYDEREGNSCHIHLSLQREDGTPVFAEGPRRCSSASSPGMLAHPAGDDAVPRAERQLLQALRARVLRARPRSRGARTTARARCASSATAPAGASSAASPGADVNPYLALAALIAGGPARHRARAPARAARSRATPTSPTSPRRARCARRASRSPPAS